MFVDFLPPSCEVFLWSLLLWFSLIWLSFKYTDNTWFVHLGKCAAHDQSLVCLEAPSNAAGCTCGFLVWEAERFEGFVIHGVWKLPGSVRSQEWEYPSLVLLPQHIGGRWEAPRRESWQICELLACFPGDAGPGARLENCHSKVTTCQWLISVEPPSHLWRKNWGKQCSVMLSERSQTQRVLHCMIPFI